MRALIVDDHPIVLQSCRRILRDAGIDDVEDSRCPGGGLRCFLRTRPDIVITDLTFADDDLAGLDLVQRLTAKGLATPILVFSMHDDPAIVSRALANGARGYALKDSPSIHLTTAIRTLLEGGTYLDHDLTIRIARQRFRRDTPDDALTERETQILSLLSTGFSNHRIAARLGISAKTVTNATSLMRTKLRLGSLAELITYAMHREN